MTPELAQLLLAAAVEARRNARIDRAKASRQPADGLAWHRHTDQAVRWDLAAQRLAELMGEAPASG